jgi:DNA-binding MarR family transcriptional regulator
MPTATQVRESETLRSRFLAALYDDAAPSRGQSDVKRLLAQVGAADLPETDASYLIKSLIEDGLVRDVVPVAAPMPIFVTLTSAGRREVEQWVSEPEQPTAHLPLPYQTVFQTTFNGPVNGSSFVQGSHDVSVKVDARKGSDLLREFVDAYRRLTSELPSDVREDAIADLETLNEQATASEPSANRVRSSVRRLMTWAAGIAGSTVTAAARAEVDKVGHQLLTIHT